MGKRERMKIQQYVEKEKDTEVIELISDGLHLLHKKARWSAEKVGLVRIRDWEKFGMSITYRFRGEST